MKERVAQKIDGSPRLLTDRSTHDMVMRVLARDFPSRGDHKKLLDAPCGAGALSMRMHELGFDVQCADIDAGNFEAEGFEHTTIDLNGRLPFDDASFDVVVSVAGLQRVCFPEVAISEFYRILKPVGRLYLSVPNFATLKKRMRFLLYGTIGNRFDRPKFVQTLQSPQSHFRFPLMYPRVEHMVCSAGFAVAGVDRDGDSRYPWLLLPVSLLVVAASWLRSKTSGGQHASYRRNSGFTMLASTAYVIRADKPGQ